MTGEASERSHPAPQGFLVSLFAKCHAKAISNLARVRRTRKLLPNWQTGRAPKAGNSGVVCQNGTDPGRASLPGNAEVSEPDGTSRRRLDREPRGDAGDPGIAGQGPAIDLEGEIPGPFA